MKASKFTEAQIAFVLRQAQDGTAVAEICRKAGISDATFYNWRKKYAGLMPSEMRRLRQLEEENAKLKRIVADLSLDKAMLQDVSQKSSEAWPQTRTCRHVAKRLEGIDQARLFNPWIDRALYVYKSKRGDQADLKQRIKEHLRDAGALRISSRPYLVAPRRMGGQRKTHLSPLQGIRPAIAQQDAEASGQGQTSR